MQDEKNAKIIEAVRKMTEHEAEILEVFLIRLQNRAYVKKGGTAMTETTVKAARREICLQELRRLILWTKDHPDDWYHLCNPESYGPNAAELSDLVERLYQEDFYSLLYFAIFANEFVRGVGGVITKTTNECFLDTPMDLLVERFRRNLKLTVKDLAPEPDEK